MCVFVCVHNVGVETVCGYRHLPEATLFNTQCFTAFRPFFNPLFAFVSVV